MLPRLPAFLVAACLLLVPGSALAETARYELGLDFLIAAAPQFTIDFEDREAPSDQSESGGFAEAGILISASDSYLFRRNYGPDTNGFLYGANGTRGSVMHVWLPPGTAAFGANVTTFHTLYTREPGRIRATLSTGPVYELTGSRWASTGLGPASSFFGVISSEPIDWIRFEATDSGDPLVFGADAVLIDNISFSLGLPATCESELALCEDTVSKCVGEQGLADADQDGEEDEHDLCPDTPPAELVDRDGCSLSQFCSRHSLDIASGGVATLRATCRRADWQNDEPLRARDCDLDRSVSDEGERSYRCVPKL